MFVNVELYNWSEQEAPDGEAELRGLREDPSPGVQLVVSGRVVQDPTRRFTHGAMLRFADLDAWDAWVADEKVAERRMNTPLATTRWYGCRVPDFNDPYLVEHGLEAWSKRVHEPVLALARRNEEYGRFLAERLFRALDNGMLPDPIAQAWLRQVAQIGSKK